MEVGLIQGGVAGTAPYKNIVISLNSFKIN
jgi:hypothetical protein